MSNTQNAAAIAELDRQAPVFAQERTMWNDAALMNTSWRTADMLSKAIPTPGRRKNRPSTTSGSRISYPSWTLSNLI